jgi:signal-transduction protein with cAMP-binding, CBS, and nucleotidyltransferase domain
MFIEGMLETAREGLVTIDAGCPLIEAAGKLCTGTDIVIVVEATGKLAGVITKTNVVEQMAVCDGASCRCAVSAVMTKVVTACTASDRLQ